MTIVNKLKRKIKLLPEDKSYPMFEVFKKTFFKDICTIPKFAGSLLILICISIISTLGLSYGELGDNAPTLEGISGMFHFYYLSFFVIFTIIITGSSAPLISSEMEHGTMLILISYPVTKKKILLAKFLAVFLFGTILIILSLAILCIVLYINYPFQDIFSFFIINLLNWLLTLFFFECIAFCISCIARTPRNAIIIPVLIIIFLMVIFSFIFKAHLLDSSEGTSLYEKYYIYLFDPTYHFGNLLFYLFKVLTNLPSDLYDLFLFFGSTEYVYPDSYETNYVSPLFSLVYLLLVPLTLLIFGYFYFKKRDINN